MTDDTVTLNRLRKYLLDTLNYYQGFVCQGRIDLLCAMQIIQTALLRSGSVVCYDDVKKRWHFV